METQQEATPNNGFEQTMKKLTALLGGKENLTNKSKLPNDEVKKLVDAILLEDKETKKTEFKNELKKLLGTYVEMEKVIEDKKKELAKLEKDKRNEFISAANKVFEKVDQLNDLENAYYKSLMTVKQGEQ